MYSRRNENPTTKLLLVAVFLCVCVVQSKICPTLDIRNDIVQLNKLKNCTAVTGNLSIVLLEKVKSPAEYEKYVFPDLTEITGYLVLYKVFHLLSVGTIMPNLRVIRGVDLISYYSLALHEMPHLTQIGLTKLLYIARGDVKVDHCPNICYVDTINWKMIGAHDLHYTHLNNQTCEPCPDICKGGYCWNLKSCQKQDTDKCHKECLDCTEHNSSKHCAACKNFENAGECVAKCPKHKFTNINKSKCMTRSECEEDSKYWILNQECVNTCPRHYQVKGKGCEYCGNNCTKVCTTQDIINDLARLQEYKGCTHIKGNLEIRVLQSNVAEELEENLGQIKVIEGYLKISRSSAIGSLRFLRNLREIQGKTLENNHHAIFMFENPNLQKLWDFNDHFKLAILNGTISFHNNPLLCISEITQLANRTGLTGTYTNLDVSPFSNGDKSSCNVIDLKITVENITTKNATFQWQKIENQSYVGYTVFYTRAKGGNETYQNKDACDPTGWHSFYTSNNFLLVKNLSPYTDYAYYIKVLSTSGGQSPVQYFRTLSDDPEIDKNQISAISYNSSSIMIYWARPWPTNGVLAYYQIVVYMEPDSSAFILQRDFCMHPQMQSKRATQITELINDSCNCTREEINIEKNDLFALCDENSISKYGFHGCETFKYDFIPYHNTITNRISDTTNINYTEFSDSQVKAIEPPNTPTKEVQVINITDVNATNYLVTNLSHFRTYVFYLTACNHNRTERQQCSSVVQVFNRTLKNPDADNVVIDVKVNDFKVTITWLDPPYPNSIILAYNIEYRKLDSTTGHSGTVKCLNKNKTTNKVTYKIYDLLSGSYYVRVQAVSLAGPGNFSPKYNFNISYPEQSYWAYIIVVLMCVLVVIAAVLFYCRYKRKGIFENLRLITNINPEYEGLDYEKDKWEIDRDNVVIEEKIGEGAFGAVFCGYIKTLNCSCAIKMIKERVGLREQIELLTEATTMKKFSETTHVIKLLGVVSVGQPFLVIMEFMERGDLKRFLHKCRGSSNNITTAEMYKMAIEIADGMAYLCSKKFVHRDLAARNCMVASDYTVKIGDFGMARDIYQSDYYRKETKGLLPVRWMAPESLLDGVFTSDSDVWSYGIVLWEIATLGEQPYQGLSNDQALDFVKNRGTLSRPQHCSDGLYDIMKSCWAWKPMRRPQFLDVIEQLLCRVGPNFELVSFYHSRDGRDYRLNHRQRAYNPPAMEPNYPNYPNVDDLLYSNYRVGDNNVSLHFRSERRPSD